jgi:hypothetical protein
MAIRRGLSAVTEGSMNIAQVMNEWMRRYTETPEQFQAEFRTVADFLKESAEGVEPTYGMVCEAYMALVWADLQK